MDVKRIMVRAVRQSHPREAPTLPAQAKAYPFRIESDGGITPLWEATIPELAIELDAHMLMMLGLEVF